MDIETTLRDINADVEVFHIPSLRMRARQAAPATVRVEERSGRRAELRSGQGDLLNGSNWLKKQTYSDSNEAS